MSSLAKPSISLPIAIPVSSATATVNATTTTHESNAWTTKLSSSVEASIDYLSSLPAVTYTAVQSVLPTSIFMSNNTVPTNLQQTVGGLMTSASTGAPPNLAKSSLSHVSSEVVASLDAPFYSSLLASSHLHSSIQQNIREFVPNVIGMQTKNLSSTRLYYTSHADINEALQMVDCLNTTVKTRLESGCHSIESIQQQMRIRKSPRQSTKVK